MCPSEAHKTKSPRQTRMTVAVCLVRCGLICEMEQRRGRESGLGKGSSALETNHLSGDHEWPTQAQTAVIRSAY